MDHIDRIEKKKKREKVQNLCNLSVRVLLFPSYVLSFSTSALVPLSSKGVTPYNMKPASHYRVFNLRAQPDSRPGACGRNLHVALL